MSNHVETEFELDREDDYVVLTVEGSFDPGEAPSRWGYYGASPGAPEDAEILGVYEELVVLGPFPKDKWGFAHTQQVIRIPWTGTLTDEEKEAVREALIEQARFDAEDAAGEAAIEAYQDAEYDAYDRY